MPERDAFGNEISPPGSAGAPAAPSPAPATPAAPTAAQPRPSFGQSSPPTRSGAPKVAGLAVGGCVSFIAVLGVAGAVLLGTVGSNAVDSVLSLSSEFSTTLDPGAPPSVTEALRDGRKQAEAAATATERENAPAPSAPPTGLARGSLLRPAAFGPGMARLRRSGLGRLRSLRVAADRIDAQLVTRDGRLRSVQITPGGVQRTLSTSPPGFPTTSTLSFAGIDAGAPQRLARSAAGRARVPLSRIDYLVLIDFAGQTSWAVYAKSGQAFMADAHGRIERRIS